MSQRLSACKSSIDRLTVDHPRLDFVLTTAPRVVLTRYNLAVGISIAFLVLSAIMLAVEHFLGYDKIIFTWICWGAASGIVGALLGILIAFVTGGAPISRHGCGSFSGTCCYELVRDIFMGLASLLLSLVTWSLIPALISALTAFLLLLAKQLELFDLYGPVLLDMPRLMEHLDKGEVVMSVVNTLITILSCLRFWYETRQGWYVSGGKCAWPVPRSLVRSVPLLPLPPRR